MVPADSRRISRVPRYSGAALAYMDRFRVRGSHPLRRRFPAPSATAPLCRSGGPTTPRGALTPAVWALARSLATTGAIILIFSSCGYWDVSVPRVRPTCLTQAVDGSRRPGFPIRTSAGRRAFAPNRGFSQLVTSFVASESHRHPPCALLCFPFSFQPRRRLSPPRRSGKKAFALQFIYCSLDSRLISLLLSFWL